MRQPICDTMCGVMYGAHVRAREAAERGVGGPASDRPGLWGGT